MGELLAFEKGCYRCEHLSRIGKNTYVCTERVHMDDTDVIPIRDGKHTSDWNICNGENYARSFNTHSSTV